MPPRPRPPRTPRLLLAESLEPRTLLSVNLIRPLAGYPIPIAPYVPPVGHLSIAFPTKVQPHAALAAATAAVAAPLDTTPVGHGYNASQIRHAYGLDQVLFGNVVGDGSGQTIAIIDAYDYPQAFADLQTFDLAFGLPDPPSFKRVSQTGSTTVYPPTDPNGPGYFAGTWELEAALDIQWSHAIAPKANILFVEAQSSSLSDLISAAVGYAKAQTSVSVISMSFGSNEFISETGFDSTFTTPSGHNPVTFVASTGDTGSPGGYPSTSPNVVAVGGTSLFLDANNNYSSESGWSSGGGGISTYESKPNYQSSIPISSNRRVAPDLALDADPNTGVAIYDSFDYPGNGWLQIGGTSVASPLFAGMIAVANQGRALAGLPTLASNTDTLTNIYSIAASDFHDITTGNNGNPAGPGYDLVTGRGSPIANLFINDLANISSIGGTAFQDRNGDGVFDAGDVPLPGATIFIDANNNGILDTGGNVTPASGTLNTTIPDNNSTGITSSIPVSLSGPITDVNVTLSITITRDSDLRAYLIGPDSTTVTLFSSVGPNGTNFSNTTLDDSAATAISSGSAPFSNSYRPSSPLSVFNGKLATGTWKLKVTDNRAGRTGTLVNWSINITTASEKSTTVAADGSYVWNLPKGSVNLAITTPANYLATGNTTATLNLTGNTTQNFGFFPTVFAAANLNDNYYLWLLPANGATPAKIQIGTSPDTALYSFPLASLPNLTFKLLADNTKLTINFANGSPLPLANLTLLGSANLASELELIGQSSAQSFTMTDTQIGPTGGPNISFTNLTSLTLDSATINYSGTLSTIQNLTINAGTIFNWG